MLVVYRTDAAKAKDPTRFMLDRRQLSEFPCIMGEGEELCILNLDRNQIPLIEHAHQ